MSREEESSDKDSVAFEILLDKEAFHAGQVASGLVKINIKHDISQESIFLSITGREKVYFEELRNRKQQKSNQIAPSGNYVATEKYLGSPRVGLRKGQYQLKFKIHLPNNIPSSFNETKSWKSSTLMKQGEINPEANEYNCVISYRLKAYISEAPMDEPPFMHTLEINITNPISPHPRQLCYESIHNIFSCLCIPTGQVLFKAFLEKPVYRTGEEVQLGMEVSNHAAVPISGIRIRMERVITLKAFSDAGYGQLVCKVEKTMITEAQLEGVLSFQASSKTYSLAIPPTAKSSCNSQFLSCEYFINILLSSSHGVASDLTLTLVISNEQGLSPLASSDSSMPAIPPS